METDLLEFLAAAESLKQSHPEVLVPVGWVALLVAWAAFQVVRPVKFGKIAEMMATTIADPGAKWKWTDATKKAISCALSNGENLVITPKKREFQIGKETVTALMGRRERKALCRRAKTVVKRLEAADYAAAKRTAEQKMAQVVNRLSPSIGEDSVGRRDQSAHSYGKVAEQRAEQRCSTVVPSVAPPATYAPAAAAQLSGPASTLNSLLSSPPPPSRWRAGTSKGKPTGNSIVLETTSGKYVINFKTRQFELNGESMNLTESEKDRLLPQVKAIARALVPGTVV